VATWNVGILVALSLQEEPDRNTQARTVDEASPAKQPANAGFAELRKSLQQERDRASKLEQDLATARRDIETQTALAAKAGAEPTQLKKTADAGSADLLKSLQQAAPQSNPEYAEVASWRARMCCSGAVTSVQRETCFSARPKWAMPWQASRLRKPMTRSFLPNEEAIVRAAMQRGALDLYARALAGGIKEAKEQSDALRR
jgi:hypothetical protein